jgi:hypothetical protein
VTLRELVEGATGTEDGCCIDGRRAGACRLDAGGADLSSAIVRNGIPSNVARSETARTLTGAIARGQAGDSQALCIGELALTVTRHQLRTCRLDVGMMRLVFQAPIRTRG